MATRRRSASRSASRTMKRAATRSAKMAGGREQKSQCGHRWLPMNENQHKNNIYK